VNKEDGAIIIENAKSIDTTVKVVKVSDPF